MILQEYKQFFEKTSVLYPEARECRKDISTTIPRISVKKRDECKYILKQSFCIAVYSEIRNKLALGDNQNTSQRSSKGFIVGVQIFSIAIQAKIQAINVAMRRKTKVQYTQNPVPICRKVEVRTSVFELGYTMMYANKEQCEINAFGESVMKERGSRRQLK